MGAMVVWAELLKAVGIGFAGGATLYLIGQALPRNWFHFDAFPYRDFKWEKSGRFYVIFKVHVWKDRVPDMSRFMSLEVRKKAALARTTEAMDGLVRETCVAEFIHWLLIFLVSPLMPLFVKGWVGVSAAAVFALGNLPFIIIQRYNRPRLRELLKHMEMRKRSK